MAQAGFTPIQLYHTSTAAAVPTAGNMVQGELALNITDGKLYFKDASNNVTLLAVAGGAGAGTVTSVSASGGTTGLTFTGSPIITTGTLTLGGTLGTNNGGTGQTTYSDGQLLIGNTATGGLSKATLTAGSGVTITNGNGTITIAATGGGGGGSVTGVTATFPATSTGGTAPVIGIAHSGGACTTSTGTGALVFNISPAFTTPNLGTPSAGNFSTGTFTWPTFNQNTTGTASNVTGTVAVANGGTGATTAANARSNLGLGTVATINTNGSTTQFLRGDGTFATPSGGTGTVTSITAGTGLSGGTITTSGTISLNNTGVVAGSYTNANITVDSQGRLTSASSGSGGGGVTSFNTRTGAVSLTSGDVTGALGYTPPQPDGTGASGTWNISISGSVANATNATNVNVTSAISTLFYPCGPTSTGTGTKSLSFVGGNFYYRPDSALYGQLHIGVNGGIVPLSDGTYSAGASSNRFSVIYAVTGTINTSDTNDKQDIEELSAAEKRVAARIKPLIKKFRFKDAVAKKGAAARIHVGVIAQEVEAAFIAEGLDAKRYGLFCEDVWYTVNGKPVSDDNTQQYDENTPGAVKVTRLGIRYEELLAFVIASL